MAKDSKAAAPASAPARERLVWRVRKGQVVPDEGGPALYPGDEMSKDDPRFARFQSALCSSWEPVGAKAAPASEVPMRVLIGEEHED